MFTAVNRNDSDCGVKRNTRTRLEKFADLAARAAVATLVEESHRLSDRLAEGRFYVACLGQFKRGKSTLINALLGEEILPVGVTPVTNVITVIRYSDRRAARIRVADNAWQAIDLSQLANYVAEDHNPANRMQVNAVEVFHPSPLLESGLCLVDTPGVGSVFSNATDTTKSFLPHIDAAIIVVGGDPPLSGEEATLVEQVASQVASFRILLNKSDRLTDVERHAVSTFTRRILSERLHKTVDPIWEVSAKERLAAKKPERDWPQLLEWLVSLAQTHGSDLVLSAERRGLSILIDRLLRELDELRGALTRPLAESEQRVGILKECARSVERSLSDLSYLFLAEQERLATIFAQRQEQFLCDVLPAARQELIQSIRAMKHKSGPALRREGFVLAKEIYRRTIDQWREREQPFAERAYRDAARRFVDLANDFLLALARSNEPSMASLPHAIGPELGFRTRSRLYYTEIERLTTPSLFEWIIDIIRPRSATLRSVERKTTEYINDLLVTNTTRLRNDFDERVLESRRRLEGEVHDLLREIYSSAERALDTARVRLEIGEEGARAELQRIDTVRSELLALRNESDGPPVEQSAKT
jgi:GTP-binding protein EngB required for normal cell division